MSRIARARLHVSPHFFVHEMSSTDTIHDVQQSRWRSDEVDKTYKQWHQQKKRAGTETPATSEVESGRVQGRVAMNELIHRRAGHTRPGRQANRDGKDQMCAGIHVPKWASLTPRTRGTQSRPAPGMADVANHSPSWSPRWRCAAHWHCTGPNC